MNTNDHDLLTRIDERIENMSEDIKELKEGFYNYNERLSKLENWKSKNMGIAITLPIIIPIIIYLIVGY